MSETIMYGTDGGNAEGDARDRQRARAVLADMGITDPVYLEGMAGCIADILQTEPEMLFSRLTVDGGMTDDDATWICQAVGI